MKPGDPESIDVQACHPQVQKLLEQFGPRGCQVLIVESVQDWANSVGLDEDNPFRAARAVMRLSDNTPLVVLLARITTDIQLSVIGAMEFRGFRDEVDRIRDLRAFLEHLVLHEIAHLVLKNATEFDCDRWAFDRLGPNPTCSV